MKQKNETILAGHSLNNKEEVSINIFSDDFSSGDLRKWSSVSPIDTTQVVDYNGIKSLCVSGMGAVTYIHSYTDGNYNLNTNSFLKMTFYFLMENKDSAPNIYITGPHGGSSFTITCDEYNLKPSVWYEVEVSTYCPPNYDPDSTYLIRLMGNATSGSTDKTFFKDVFVTQTYLLDTTFEDNSWADNFIKNDDFTYVTNGGILTISAKNLPKASETPAVLLKCQDDFELPVYNVHGMMSCYVTLSGEGVGSGVSVTNHLSSQLIDFKNTIAIAGINNTQELMQLTVMPDNYTHTLTANNSSESNSGAEFKVHRVVVGKQYMNISEI